MLFVLFMKW